MVAPNEAGRPTGPDPNATLGLGGPILAAGLMTLGAGLHVAAVFPAQGPRAAAFDGHAYLVVQQVVLAIGWLAAAGLVGRRRLVRVTAGTALAVGIAVAELGLVVTNLSQVLAASSAGAGAWLVVAAWAVGAVGAVVSLAAVRRAGPGVLTVVGRPGRLSGRESIVTAAFAGLAAIVVGIALLPAWDHYVITSSSLGRTIGRESLGSAFESGTPVGVLGGDLVTAVAFAVVPLVAMWWRPGRVGVFLCSGVLVVVGSELVSAVVGFRSSAGDLGFTAAQVSTYGIRVHSSLTAWWVVELIAGVALLLLVLARSWTPDDWSSDSRTLPFGPGGAIDGAGPARPGWEPSRAAPDGWGPPVPPPAVGVVSEE